MGIGSKEDCTDRALLGRWAVQTLLLVSLTFLSPSAVFAQGGEWPTLSGAGLEYLSRSGFLQATLSGQLDFEAIHVGDSWAGLVGREAGEEPIPDERLRCLACHEELGLRGSGGDFTAHRLRLFADLFLGDHLYSLLEVRSDRGNAPSDGQISTRVEQAYVRLSSARGSTAIQLGRFASPFGAYPMRHLTVVDPFLRPPLSYDYRTIMSRRLRPVDVLKLQKWKDAPEFFRKGGSPPVWDVPYQWGAMVFSRVGSIDFRVAAMNSAPSSDPDAWAFDWGRAKRPSWVAAARMKPSASFDVGLSYSRGPWMEGMIRENAPADWVPPSPRDFDQELISADFTFARGPLMLRGEAILDRWEVPAIGDRPTDMLYNLELQWDLATGISFATRFGYIDFRPLRDEGTTEPSADWDYDVYRYEASLGYRLMRNVGVLLSAYKQVQDVAEDGDTVLTGLRLWWAF